MLVAEAAAVALMLLSGLVVVMVVQVVEEKVADGVPLHLIVKQQVQQTLVVVAAAV